MIRYKEFFIHQHINNPGHWLHNGEIWAALASAVPSEMTAPPSENGYVRPPFVKVGSGYFYELQIGGDNKREKEVVFLVEKSMTVLEQAAKEALAQAA